MTFFWVFPSSGRTRSVLWCRALQTDSTGIGVFLTKGRHKVFVNSSCWNDKGCTFYLYSLCYSNSVWDILFLSPAVPNSLGKGKNKLKLCCGTWSVQSKSDSLSGIWTLVSKIIVIMLFCVLCNTYFALQGQNLPKHIYFKLCQMFLKGQNKLYLLLVYLFEKHP